MNLLTVDNITKSYSERKLFDGASFYLSEGEKIGIIGINGTGKSTLLKMVAGLEEPEEGQVIKANHVIVKYLPQDPQFLDEETVLESVLRGNLKNGMDEATLQSEAKSMLNKLGVLDFHAKCNILSGGQRKRIALVNVLLSPCDILILDEPTNHLDNEMAEWLEETLKKWKGSQIMVTHDRYFLDSVANRIIEIDRGQICSYEGGYSSYLELKAQREEMNQASERKKASLLRTELEWVQRGARARSTKQKARLQRYEELKNSEKLGQNGKVELSSVHTRLGKTTLELQGIGKSYGDKTLIKDFDYIFLKNDRVGFIGPNGCGKTTLMKLLIGELAPDQGNIIKGQTVKIGYYAQEVSSYMDPQKRVIDYVRDVAEYVQTTDGQISASAMLERFLFEGSDQYSLLGKLSGGEKRRLNLLRVLMDAPNILVLDEPTNDLDIQTLSILENYLDNFSGIVIMVSHDRYFLDRVAARLFAFEGDGKITQYEGGYSDYLLKQTIKEEKLDLKDTQSLGAKELKKSKESKETWKIKEKKLKFSYQEQIEYETIEADLEEIEEKLLKIEAEILKATTDFVKLNQFTKEKEDLLELQEQKMERWMYLEDLADQISKQ